MSKMIHSIIEVVRRFKQEWTSQLDDQAIEQVCRVLRPKVFDPTYSRMNVR
jgi:hypothetical protein